MKKILPPFLFVLFVVTMAGICWKTESAHHILYPYNLFGLPIILCGLALAVVAKKLFQKLKTNVMTFDYPGVLVAEGPFRYSRNPMYLGFVISLAGFAVLLGGAVSSFVLTMLFLIVTDRWYVAFEEKMMIKKFGKDYEEYCQNVRRWI